MRLAGSWRTRAEGKPLRLVEMSYRQVGFRLRFVEVGRGASKCDHFSVKCLLREAARLYSYTVVRALNRMLTA